MKRNRSKTGRGRRTSPGSSLARIEPIEEPMAPIVVVDKAGVAGPASSNVAMSRTQFRIPIGVSKADHARAYETLSWVQKACEIIATNGSTVPVHVMRKGQDEPLERGPMVDLLDRVNDEEPWEDLLERSLTDYCWSGSFAWEYGTVGRKVKALATLEPWRVAIMTDGRGVSALSVWIGVGDNVELERGKFLYFYRYNPLQAFEPLSPLRALEMTVSTDLGHQVLQDNLLKEGGFPSGLLAFPNPLGPNQTKRVRAEWDKLHRGAGRAGKTAIVSGGGEYHRLVLTPDELKFLEARRFTREEVAMAYGVPPFMLADVDATAYSNADAQLAFFWRETMKPLLRKVYRTMTHHLAPRVEPGVSLVPDFSEVDRLLETEEAITENATKGFQRGILTLNEARRKMQLQPVDGGEVLLQPLNSRIVDTDGNVVHDPAAIEFPSPEPETVVDDNDPEGDPGEGAKSLSRSKAADFDKLRANVFRAHNTQRKKAAGTIRKALLGAFRDQRERILAEVHDTEPGNLPDFTLDAEAEARSLQRAIAPTLAQVIATVAERSLGRFGFSKVEGKERKAIAADWDVPHMSLFVVKGEEEDIVEEILGDFGLTNPRLLTYVRDTLGNNLRGVTEAQVELVKATIQEAYTEGASTFDVAKAIEAELIGFGAVRSARVALTEAGTAANLGSYEAGREVGVTGKSWLSLRIGKSRHNHIDMEKATQSQPIPYDDAFGAQDHTTGILSVPQQFPNDPTGAAEENVNCHCTFLFEELGLGEGKALDRYFRSFGT